MNQRNLKYLAIGGLHGNEPLGIELVPKIQALQVDWLKAEFGNPQAIKQNVRFVEEDLNRVFPGNANGNHEQKRAAKLTKISQSFDFVLDFHNTYGLNNDCGFVGGNDWEKTVNLAGFLGIKRVIIADYDCINKFVPNCLSIEISLNSIQNNTNLWVNKLQNLNKFDPNKKYQAVELYQFIYRVSRQQQNKLNFKNWKTFEPISKRDTKKLGLNPSQEYLPIFIDDQYTAEYNFAGLLKKV